MPKLKRIILENYCYFVTTNIYKKKNVFKDNRIVQILIEDLEFYRKKYDFRLHAFVIMPDHLHLLITPSEKGDISKIMHDFKSHTSQVINKSLGWNSSLWQEGFYEHVIRDRFDFRRKIDYIHKNPLMAGIVKVLEAYQFSSFRNYYLEDEDLIKVDKILF